MATYSLTNSNSRNLYFAFNSTLEKTVIAANPANLLSKVNAKKVVTANKYDESYEKESEASFAGVFMLLIPVIFTLFFLAEQAQYYAMSSFVNIMVVGGLIIRLVAVKWMANISAEQNRKKDTWMLLSFLLPGISLLIIGQTKKLATAQKEQAAGFLFQGHYIFSNNNQHKIQLAS